MRGLVHESVLMTHLKTPEMSNFIRYIDVHSLANLYSRGVGSNLVSLTVTRSAITDKELVSIASIATLKELDIFACMCVTAVDIGQLASWATQLQSLDLGGCWNVDDWVEADERHSLSSTR